MFVCLLMLIIYSQKDLSSVSNDIYLKVTSFSFKEKKCIVYYVSTSRKIYNGKIKKIKNKKMDKFREFKFQDVIKKAAIHFPWIH